MLNWTTKVASVLIALLAVRWCWRKAFPQQTNESFYHKNVVICGASTGIGKEVAYRFSEQGAHVILVARRENALQKVKDNCTKLGASTVTFVTADLSSVEEARRVVKETLNELGSIDVLVLNHVLYEVQRWESNRDLNEIKKAFDVNVISYINLVTLFLPSLQATGGRIVAVSSGLGVFTYPYFALYCANKHALHGFFNALRQDLALGRTGDKEMSITISVLGAIRTESAVNVSKGNPVAGEEGWTRASAVDASRAIVEGSLRRERQTYFPSALKLHELASFHFPTAMEKLIRYVYGLDS